jgi:hypothetical protein
MRKNIFNFSPESIIEANLNLQTVQRSLYNDYKIYNPKSETITSAKFICTYKNWDIKKREDFIKTIGGNGNFKKLKNYFESKLKE